MEWNWKSSETNLKERYEYIASNKLKSIMLLNIQLQVKQRKGIVENDVTHLELDQTKNWLQQNWDIPSASPILTL